MTWRLNRKKIYYFLDISFLIISSIYGIAYFFSIALGFQEPLTPLAIPLSLLLASVALFTLLARKRLGSNFVVFTLTTLGLFWSLNYIDNIPRYNEHLRFLLNPYYAIVFAVLITACCTYFGIMKKRGWI